jgi:hypothetical protein
MFFARGLDGANHIGITGEFSSTVIPGRCDSIEPGIHFSTCVRGPMDSGLATSSRPGMTAVVLVCPNSKREWVVNTSSPRTHCSAWEPTRSASLISNRTRRASSSYG